MSTQMDKKIDLSRFNKVGVYYVVCGIKLKQHMMYQLLFLHELEHHSILYHSLFVRLGSLASRNLISTQLSEQGVLYSKLTHKARDVIKEIIQQ